MEERKKEEVGKDCLSKARKYFAEENWARAYGHALMYLELLPGNRLAFEQEFEGILYRLSIWLESRNLYEELYKNYLQGLQYFPSNVRILTNFGAHLLRLEEPEEALYYLESAQEIDGSFLLVEKHIQSAKLQLIPRWHFRMLNDRNRNEAYRTAIHKAITPQHNKVLDIGCGCGLLSFYASECTNAKSIIAVESSEVLAKIASNALINSDVPVTVINKESTNLCGSEIGLSNLLVTEIFDAAFFGERVLSTLIHAWDNLLEPSAKVIPCSADIFVTGISSDVLLIRQKVCNKLPQLKLENVCIRQFRTEPYEAENLSEISVKYITNTQKATNVNFNEVEQLKNIYKNVEGIPPATLKCVRSGTVEAFAVWFDLHLDANVTITTNPLAENNRVKCWEQAVIYLDHPMTVEEDQEIKVQLSCVSDTLSIEIVDSPSTTTCENCFEVSQSIVTFLNDVQVVEAAEDLKLPNRFNIKNCQILDLNPFPLFALFRAKRGFPGVYNCMAEAYADKIFMERVWRSNGFCSVDDDTCSTHDNCNITFNVFYFRELNNHLKENSLDVVYINPVSNNGILWEETFDYLPYYTFALKSDGLLLPRNIKLQIELMDSKYLDFCNKVDAENLLGFYVGAHNMNEYSIEEQWQVRPQYYQRKTLRQFITRYNTLTNGLDSVASADYDVNVPINGIANGVLYWYKMEFLENVCIDTYKSVHYNGACFIFKRSQVVSGGDTITINVRQDKGLLKISCNDES